LPPCPFLGPDLEADDDADATVRLQRRPRRRRMYVEDEANDENLSRASIASQLQKTAKQNPTPPLSSVPLCVLCAPPPSQRRKIAKRTQSQTLPNPSTNAAARAAGRPTPPTGRHP
jgi:hypothetical protein